MSPLPPCADTLSVVVPALDEAGGIAGALERAFAGNPLEVIVVDGGSTDGTPDAARSLGAKVLFSERGRAAQMNAGAGAARGAALLFLHADTLLPPGYAGVVADTLGRPGVVAGAFSLSLDGSGAGLGFVAGAATWRSRVLGWPYGDQGIFLKRGTFFEVGGYPELPILEDVELLRRVRKRGRVVTVHPSVVTSSRRWARWGVVRTTLLNQVILLAYGLGASPWILERWYRRGVGVLRPPGRNPDGG